LIRSLMGMPSFINIYRLSGSKIVDFYIQQYL
jgi:hypothetical protein